MKNILTQKNIIIAIVAFLFIALVVVVYRMFFQFNSKDVAIYIKEEADKYQGNEDVIYKLIQDGVEHTLSSHNLTQQVIKSARASKVPKEQVLVHSAIMKCKAYGYLNF